MDHITGYNLSRTWSWLWN